LHPPVLPSINLQLALDIASSVVLATNPPTFVGCQPSGCAVDQPPTCIGYCILRRCQRSASDSHRRCAFRLSLPVVLRLAPPTDPPALPSNSTSDLRRLWRSPARPSRQPATCAACQLSSPALEPNLRLSSAVASPAPPSGQPPTCAGCWPSRLAFELNLRLSPVVASSVSAFWLTFGLRRRSTLQPRLRNSTSDELRRHQLRRTLGLANLCTQVQIDRLLWISSSSPQAERPIPQRSRRRVTAWLGWRIYFGSLKGREPSASILKMRKSWRKLHFYRRPCERTLRSPATAKDKVNTLSFFSNPIASLILSIAGLSA
jgi:hypothetical protein